MKYLLENDQESCYDNDTAKILELRICQDPEVNPITSPVQMLFLRWKTIGERELSQSSVACKLEHGDIVGSMSPAGLLVLSWGTM